jgi:glucokinase
MNTLAIDIGGTKFAVALFDDDRMIRREAMSTDRGGGREWLIPQLDAIIAQWQREGAKFDRCGISFGGPVNFETQTVNVSTHVGGWEGFPLTRHIAETAGVSVIMDNDANAGALGEYLFGAGRGCSPLFYMTLSTGIGGGILLDGKVK